MMTIKDTRFKCRDINFQIARQQPKLGPIDLPRIGDMPEPICKLSVI